MNDDGDSDGDDNDNDDSCASSFSSEEDFVFYNNPANIFIDMHGNTFTLNDNDKVILYDDDADDDKPMTTQATQQEIDTILDHDIFLFHRWSGKTPCLVNKKATTKACTTLENAQIKTPAVKDDPSVTPTLSLRHFLHPAHKPHTKLPHYWSHPLIMIWNQPLVK